MKKSDLLKLLKQHHNALQKAYCCILELEAELNRKLQLAIDRESKDKAHILMLQKNCSNYVLELSRHEDKIQYYESLFVTSKKEITELKLTVAEHQGRSDKLEAANSHLIAALSNIDYAKNI